MKKPIQKIWFIIGGLCFFSSLVFASSNDLERSLKEMEREMMAQVKQTRELRRQQELPQNNELAVTSSQVLFKQPIGGLNQNIFPKMVATDRAMEKNQERLKEMMDAQSRAVLQSDSGYFGIPKASRGVVDLIVILLFVSLGSFVFYRRKIKKTIATESKEEEEDLKKRKEMKKYYKYYKEHQKES